MPILFLLLSFAAMAEPVNVRNLTEKTYTRDNTYCRLAKARVEIQIRSHAATTEPREKNYGEYVFYYPKVKPHLLPINVDKLNSYRLFTGQGSLCSKSLAFPVGEKIAVLLLKENRPFEDKLSIQLFDQKSGEPDAFVETDYLTDKAELAPDGFVFRNYVEKSLNPEFGKVTIAGNSFVYQDRGFSFWMKYSVKGFEAVPSVSYQKFNWMKLYKDEKDFLEASGWDDSTQTFKNKLVYLAVNHKLKKECVLLIDKKIKPDGSENWRCN